MFVRSYPVFVRLFARSFVFVHQFSSTVAMSLLECKSFNLLDELVLFPNLLFPTLCMHSLFKMSPLSVYGPSLRKATLALITHTSTCYHSRTSMSQHPSL